MHKRKKVKQYYKELRTNKYIVNFGGIVRAQNLWLFNRHAVIWGIIIGIMCSWIPLPFHTTVAVVIAIVVDCNIPLVVTSIWFANPFTMPFMYYSAFRLGEFILRQSPADIAFHLSMKDLLAEFDQIWQPLLLGCLVCSVFCGIMTYGLLSFFWYFTPRFRNRMLNKIR